MIIFGTQGMIMRRGSATPSYAATQEVNISNARYDNAQRFCSTFMRSNASRTAADDIRQVDHNIIIRHTPLERALYLQRVNQMGYDRVNNENLNSK
jgi:hypothetical protein